MNDRRMWGLLAAGSAAFGGWVMRRALEQGWRATRGEDPPKNPGAADVDWRDAILWSVAAGVTIGLGRVLAQRAAARGWNLLKGGAPPV